MNKEKLTRREVIDFLGFKLPIMLLAVESLPGLARAGETYTQVTFRVSPSRKEQGLQSFESSPDRIIVGAEFDATGKPIGSLVLEIDEKPADLTHLKKNALIRSINDEPFVIQTQDDFDNWRYKIMDMIRDTQKITLDVDMDGKPYLYVFEL
jgi:hypothetical protein